jgi:hypothetical protein
MKPSLTERPIGARTIPGSAMGACSAGHGDAPAEQDYRRGPFDGPGLGGRNTAPGPHPHLHLGRACALALIASAISAALLANI